MSYLAALRAAHEHAQTEVPKVPEGVVREPFGTSGTPPPTLVEPESKQVHAIGDRFRVDVPEHAPTPELQARLTAAKPEPLKLPAAPSLDDGLAVREVLTFPAALLSQLPLPTTLVLDLPDGRRATIATHPDCGRADHDLAAWAAWCASVPGGTVADVLAIRGATLRMVVLECGK